jgi:hypothetical protein
MPVLPTSLIARSGLPPVRADLVVPGGTVLFRPDRTQRRSHRAHLLAAKRSMEYAFMEIVTDEGERTIIAGERGTFVPMDRRRVQGRDLREGDWVRTIADDGDTIFSTWSQIARIRRWREPTGRECVVFRFRYGLRRQFVVDGFVYSEEGSEVERARQRDSFQRFYLRRNGRTDEPVVAGASCVSARTDTFFSAMTVPPGSPKCRAAMKSLLRA